MASWQEITAAYRSVATGYAPEAAAEVFRSLIRGTEAAPLYHLVPILDRLRELEERTGKARGDLRILDHGCGGGLTLCYLAALGYRNGFGVDVSTDIAKADAALRHISQRSEPCLFSTDGVRLPFPDRSFDLIFSQQVLEHVKEPLIEPYFREERRLLAAGGLVYHQIPHRWTPWESHTRTWFLHYLPKAAQRRVYGWLGQDPDYIADLLNLHSPVFYKNRMRMHFAKVHDATLERLKLVPDPSYYDGNIRLRRAVGWAATLPLFRKFVPCLVMIDLVGEAPPG